MSVSLEFRVGVGFVFTRSAIIIGSCVKEIATPSITGRCNVTWKPHVTVAAVVERHSRFLIVEEQDQGKIVYNQPAGHLEPDESLLQAVARETLEETGWHIRPTALVGVYQWTSPGNGVTYLRACFAGECLQHEVDRALDEGILRALWLSREELLALSPQLRSPLVLRCIDDYLAGPGYPLDVIHHLT